jgi:hypothetical protein
MDSIRPIAEIISNLSKPIPDRLLKNKTVGGQKIRFIPWHTAVKFLDLYAPGWSYEIRMVTGIKDRVIVVARISIPCAEGIIYRDATGQEEADVGSYGDPSSNAESMSLRRAAAKFGLGLYLYDAKETKREKASP